jgi:uncharacterized membrane protein
MFDTVIQKSFRNTNGQRRGSKVEELIVMGFADKHRAVEVLPQLQRLQFAWSAEMHDAIAIEVESDGRLRLMHSQMLDPTNSIGDVARLKALLSAIVPLPHAPVSSAPEVSSEYRGVNSGASAWLKNSSLDPDFLRNVAAVLQPGNSAIFAFIRDWPSAAPVLSGYSSLVLHSSTTEVKQAKTNRAL